METNILIAKFMGVEIVERNNSPAVYMIPNGLFPEYFYATHHNRYHEDWNHLMPVVEKIEHEQGGMFTDIAGSQDVYVVVIRRSSDDMQLVAEHGSNRLTTIYNAVVAFIKLHTAQPPTINQ